jgi:hypothetical protein
MINTTTMMATKTMKGETNNKQTNALMRLRERAKQIKHKIQKF